MPHTLTRTAAHLAEALLWSENDNSDETGGEPLDRNYSTTDIDPADLARLEAEYETFLEAADQLLDQAIAAGTLPSWFDPAEHSLADLGPNREGQMEHDYILTRNHHGCGFWDGDWKALGNELTRLAQSLPEICATVDGGTVYLY